ncbi:hypothetical protein BC827DRAFT_551368 [Russula dissimulans]|nr:hypothetical protein BC827DRAFT_551368 [Russula dissimulans]
MVKFYDTGIIEKGPSVSEKLWHTLSGLFLYEFVTTLDYEWKVIQGHLPYRWTIWVYSLTRVATLAYIILDIICLDTSKIYHCQVAATIQFVLGYTAFAAASLLIVLRIIAIWNRKKVIMMMAYGLWLANLAFLIQVAVRIRSVWAPAQSSCIVTNILSYDGIGMSNLARFLWKQGVIWLLIAIVAEVPPVVLILLNKNDTLNFMFQPPSVIIMTITATRMYRSLADFVYGSTEVQSTSFRKRSLPVSQPKQISAPRTSLSQMQVAVHIPYQNYSGSRTTAHDSSVDLDEKRPDQPKKPIVDDHDRESGIDESVMV